MKRLALIALVAFGAGCKQQDAALSITMFGQFLVPQNADHLRIDVLDFPANTLILGQDWCYVQTTACPNNLPPMPSGLNATVTIVESGAAHPQVKVNATLYLGNSNQPVGLGTVQASFVDGQTVQIQIPVSRPL